MNLQEASLPASLMVSWLHFHPIVQLWTLLLRRRLVRLARLLCRPLFPFLGFPPFFVAVAWRILFGLCRPPVSICDLSCGGAQLLLCRSACQLACEVSPSFGHLLVRVQS